MSRGLPKTVEIIGYAGEPLHAATITLNTVTFLDGLIRGNWQVNAWMICQASPFVCFARHRFWHDVPPRFEFRDGSIHRVRKD